MHEFISKYPYSYGDKLTPETVRSNRNKIKKIIILIWLLKVSQVQATPLPGAEGFTPVYLCRERYIFTKSSSIRKNQYFNPQNTPGADKTTISEYIREVDRKFAPSQLQRKYKHAENFGVLGNHNLENNKLFKEKIIEHMKNPLTQVIPGTYRGDPVTHHINKETGLNAFFNEESKEFISGWLLTPKQFENVINRGDL